MRLALALLALLFPFRTAAQSVEQEVRAEVAHYVRAINTGDPTAVASLYLNDSSASTLGDGQIHQGWHAIANVVRAVYAQVGVIEMTVDSVFVLPLGRDGAVAIARYRWLVGRKEPQEVTGAITLVFARTPEGWRVAHDHTSTLATSASVVAPAATPPVSGPTQPVRQTYSCLVTRIVDGDTIECSRMGRVRLIGMDTPELSQPPFGAQASSALATLIPPGSPVQLEQDVETRDRYGRLLAYVWADSALVNWRMVREGWAVLLTYPPNVQYVDWLVAAERQAREERRGLWATGGFDCRPVDRRRGRC